VAPREGLHGDRYDFNDAIVPIALRYWIHLAERALPREGGTSVIPPSRR
jgi:hippurate hydrolase